MSADRIFSYWSDAGHGAAGHGNALVELCLRTIERNSGCPFSLITPKNARAFLDFDKRWLLLRPAHQADLVRLRVLRDYGGMWMDADTIVQRSLQPLFRRLASESLDCIGCDWKPEQLPAEHQPYAIGVMGPMRPAQTFVEKAIVSQQALLEREERWFLQPQGPYPFQWGELLADIISTTFALYPPPRALIFNGARTWFGITGTDAWAGGDLANAMDPAEEGDPRVESLRHLPLLTLTQSLYPEEFTRSSEEAILASGTIVGALLRSAVRPNGSA